MNKTTIDRIQASKQKEGGFTLIELLIVIVILGILAGVVIFASAGFRNKGAAESCKTNLASVKTAVEAFHVDSATALFPAAWADITGGATSYFDANGVTHGSVAANTVAGKGWSFVMTFDTTGIADNPPTYAAGVPANGVTCV